tara:strand:- start:4130 stop:5158 length:1029 start_codon:yes stop_codon:yes gene_type:complete
MEKSVPINELDVFYISYDEPRKEEHWAKILDNVPWAKRVDGVKGFDNAHKECARQSETERFVTIDGDNEIDPKFFDNRLTITAKTEKSIFSWSAVNVINGLIYGNGGLKVWPVDTTLAMNTHEAAEGEVAAVDFCWDLDYQQKNDVYSTSYPNGSPYQAFRAGFREGVKMSLHEGSKIGIKDFRPFGPDGTKYEGWNSGARIWHKNYQRMIIWMTVGADVENGLWGMLGSRLGCQMTNLTDWDHTLISDYDWFTNFFENDIAPNFAGTDETCYYTGLDWSKEKVWNRIKELGEQLRVDLNLKIADFDEAGSKFFKEVYVNPTRVGFNYDEKFTEWLQISRKT